MDKMFEFPGPDQAEIEAKKKKDLSGEANEVNKADNVIFLDQEKPEAVSDSAPNEKKLANPKEEFIMKLKDVAAFLQELSRRNPGAIKDADVQKNREALRQEPSMQKLENIIRAADEIKMRRNPSFYQAVKDEIIDRRLNFRS